MGLYEAIFLTKSQRDSLKHAEDDATRVKIGYDERSQKRRDYEKERDGF